MAIQIFGIEKCFETKKAARFFKERGISYHFVDLKEKPFSKGELTKIIQKIPITELLNKESRLFREKGLHVSSMNPDHLFNHILESPLLVKMPVIRSGTDVVVGYDEAKIKEKFSQP